MRTLRKNCSRYIFMLIAPNKQNPIATTKHPISDPLPMGIPGRAGLCALSWGLLLLWCPLWFFRQPELGERKPHKLPVGHGLCLSRMWLQTSWQRFMEHETFLKTQRQPLRAGPWTTAASSSLAQSVCGHYF